MQTNSETTAGTARSVAEQVEALMSRMTLEQKVAQLQCTIPVAGHVESGLAKFSHGPGALGTISTGESVEADAGHYDQVQTMVSGEDELAIPPLLHGEAVSGWTGTGGTVFPSAIGLGATWNPEIVERMTTVIRKQMLSV